MMGAIKGMNEDAPMPQPRPSSLSKARSRTDMGIERQHAQLGLWARRRGGAERRARGTVHLSRAARKSGRHLICQPPSEAKERSFAPPQRSTMLPPKTGVESYTACTKA